MGEKKIVHKEIVIPFFEGTVLLGIKDLVDYY